MIVRSDIVQCDKATAHILVKKLSDKFGHSIPFVASHLLTATQVMEGKRNMPWTVQIAGAEWTEPQLLTVIRVWAEGFVAGRE